MTVRSAKQLTVYIKAYELAMQVEADEAFDPVDIALLGAIGEVLHSSSMADLIKEFHNDSWGK